MLVATKILTPTDVAKCLGYIQHLRHERLEDIVENTDELQYKVFPLLVIFYFMLVVFCELP